MVRKSKLTSNNDEKDYSMVSVIIPMYNASRTIKRCLLSLMKQSYHDLEIIVIDDGSTDGGRDIVSDLAKDDERIRYIRQENGGVSSARNHGLDVSRGDFICFVDSDDAITEDYIALLYSSMNEKQCDVAMCGYCEVIEEKKIDHVITKAEESSLQGILQKDLYILKDFIYSPGMKIYRSHFIRQLHLRFREDMVLAEDQFFNYHYYKMCKTVAFVNQPNYIYFRDDSGLSKVINLQCCENELENLLYETDFMEQQRIEGREQIIAEYICYLVRRYTFIPGEKNTRAEAVTRLRRMKLLDKRIVLPYWKNNLIYQLMYRKLYNLVYLYRKIGTMIHA